MTCRAGQPPNSPVASGRQRIRSGPSVGTAAGLSRTSIYLGAILSSSLLGVVLGRRPSDHGMHTIGWIIVGASVLVLVLTVIDRALRSTPRPLKGARAPSFPGGLAW